MSSFVCLLHAYLLLLYLNSLKHCGHLLDKVASSSFAKMVFLSPFVLIYFFGVVSSTNPTITSTNPTSTNLTTTSTSLWPSHASASIPTFPSCLQGNTTWAAEASEHLLSNNCLLTQLINICLTIHQKSKAF